MPRMTCLFLRRLPEDNTEHNKIKKVEKSENNDLKIT